MLIIQQLSKRLHGMGKIAKKENGFHINYLLSKRGEKIAENEEKYFDYDIHLLSCLNKSV